MKHRPDRFAPSSSSRRRRRRLIFELKPFAQCLNLAVPEIDQVSERRILRRVSQRKHSSSFGPIKQVGVGVSIGFPLLVVGVLTLMLLIVSWVPTGTLLWILAGAIAALGLLAAASRWVL
jgi:hypothetical protein